jgi:uncharacterized protein
VRLVDANVLLYAVNTSDREHEVARTWLERSLSAKEPVAFVWIALLAFIRVSTRQGIFPRPLAPETAFEFVEQWLSQPASVVLDPTPRHLAVLRGLLNSAGTAGNLTSDAHLAALALEHGAEVWSFDRDFARFPGLRSRVPGVDG